MAEESKVREVYPVVMFLNRGFPFARPDAAIKDFRPEVVKVDSRTAEPASEPDPKFSSSAIVSATPSEPDGSESGDQQNESQTKILPISLSENLDNPVSVEKAAPLTPSLPTLVQPQPGDLELPVLSTGPTVTE